MCNVMHYSKHTILMCAHYVHLMCRLQFSFPLCLSTYTISLYSYLDSHTCEHGRPDLAGETTLACQCIYCAYSAFLLRMRIRRNAKPRTYTLFCTMACEAPGGNDDNDDKKPSRETKKKNGYECEFVEPPPKHLQNECPICLQILREPHLINCCGHNYCEACIERVGKDGKPCPLCNEPGFTTMANKGLKRTLHEFRVYCPHRLSGCEWEGELGRLDEHLNSDPLPERQLKGCPFAVIECFHCKEGIRRDKIAGHQLERCPQRPYMCEYCAEYKSTFEDVAHSHWPECKCFLLPCPNECTPSGSGIQRQCLDQHVKEQCPLTVVQCELHHAGCEVTLPRKDMADHMKEDSIAHISLLAAENHRLSKRLLEKEEQICLLTQQNAELEEETTIQSQDLREKVTSQSQELTRTKQELTRTKQELTRTKQELMQELAQKVASLSQELTRVKQELKQKATSQDQELEGKLKEAQRQAIDRLQTQQQRDLQELRTEVEMQNIVPVTVAGFDELKKKGANWYSRPFYTGVGGYKMCLHVYANGCGAGKGTHVSVFTCLMRGEFDSHLKWPFRGTVTIQLVNQLEDNEHHTETITYRAYTTPETSAARVTDGERSEGGWGWFEFLPHSELGLSVANNRQYLKDDCLIFRIMSVKLN